MVNLLRLGQSITETETETETETDTETNSPAATSETYARSAVHTRTAIFLTNGSVRSGAAYERRLSTNIALNAGLYVNTVDGRDDLFGVAYSLSLNWLSHPEKAHHFEATLASWYVPAYVSGIELEPSVGYRYQKQDGGLIFSVGVGINASYSSWGWAF